MSRVPSAASSQVALAYAPPARSKARPAIVIVCGLLTTIGALLGVWWLNEHSQENVMGWYANYVIPAGALIVGLVAASGYGIASYVTGVKIRRGLLVTILAMQALAYVGAQYVEYRAADPWHLVETGGTPITVDGKTVQVARMSFLQYFHENAVSFAWKDKATGKPGEPLGMWGYAFRLLEVAGFLLGGVIVPMAMMTAAYCELCQVYMKTKPIATIAASAPVKKVKKKDVEGQAAYGREVEAARAAGTAKIEQLRSAAAAGDVRTFRQLLTEQASLKKANGKLPERVEVSVVHCKGCASGHLKVVSVAGQGKQVKRTELAKTELNPDFVRGWRASVT